MLLRLNQEANQMELVHRTPVEDVPYAICPFQGKVLIGIGKTLRLYDYGKKKMLKKSENKVSFFFQLMIWDCKKIVFVVKLGDDNDYTFDDLHLIFLCSAVLRVLLKKLPTNLLIIYNFCSVAV